MIIAIASILSLSPIADTVAAILDTFEFSYAYGDTTEIESNFSYRNASTGTSIRLRWSPLPSNKSPEDILEFWRRTHGTWDFVHEMPSKLPISGIVLDGTAGSSDKYISFGTRPATGRVYLHAKITKVNGRPSYSGVDESAPKLLEGLVRWIIATESGAKFTPGNITADGHTYQAFKDAAGKWHVDAKAWAERHGWSYTENFKEGRIQFTTPRGNFLLPLGSEKVKLGSTWHTLPLLVSARDRRILLSPEARQLASQ